MDLLALCVIRSARSTYLDHHGLRLSDLEVDVTIRFIALIPVVGDVADALLNYSLVVRKARQADIPPWLLRKMLLNNTVSTGLSYVLSHLLWPPKLLC